MNRLILAINHIRPGKDLTNQKVHLAPEQKVKVLKLVNIFGW